jgi:hypothetical protein
MCFAAVHLFLQLCICFCSCAIFLQLCYFFAVVQISCMISTHNFCSCAIYYAVVQFFLQLYNFFCSCTIFFAVVQFTPRPDEILDNAKTSNSTYVDLEQQKKGPLGDFPLSLSPKPGYLRQPSPRNYFVQGTWGCAVEIPTE